MMDADPIEQGSTNEVTNENNHSISMEMSDVQKQPKLDASNKDDATIDNCHFVTSIDQSEMDVSDQQNSKQTNGLSGTAVDHSEVDQCEVDTSTDDFIPLATDDQLDSATTAQVNNPYTQFELVRNPRCLTKFEVKEKNNFFKGCKWSNDGSCLMTCSNDKTIKLFNLPSNFSSLPVDFDSPIELNVDLKIQEGGLIYDYCLNPNLNSADSSSCFLLTTSHGSPIHMFDAYTGRRLNNYVAYTDTEEETFAHSILVNPITNVLYAGYKNAIRFYDLNRPGKHSVLMETYYQKEGQQGLITCLAINPSNTDIFAAGSYSKQLALYSESEMKQICVILGHEGGLTHMKFSYDGTKLFTGSRKENEIICWDIRYLSSILYSLKRDSNTNQRMYFDTNFYSNYLLSGNLDGDISLFNLDEIEKIQESSHKNDEVIHEPTFKFKAHQDSVNGVSLHPFYPLLASCSGKRTLKQLETMMISSSTTTKSR